MFQLGKTELLVQNIPAIQRRKNGATVMMKRLSDINWNQVYYFYEVARKLSMKEAAGLTGVSTSTISEHIKKLEVLLDVKLFRREPRQLTLTNEGRDLYHCAEEMFNSGVRFLDAVSPKSIGGYPAKIGVLETMSMKLPVDFVTSYLKFFTDFGSVNTIRETVHERMESKILQGDLDWGISLYRPQRTELECKLIGQSEIVFCTSRELAKRYRDKGELLEKKPLVRSSWDHKLNKIIDDHLEMHGIHVEEYFESDHRNFCISMMQKGICVSTFPKDEIQKSSWARDLRFFSLGAPIYLPFYALWPKGRKKMISIKKLEECLRHQRSR